MYDARGYGTKLQIVNRSTDVRHCWYSILSCVQITLIQYLRHYTEAVTSIATTSELALVSLKRHSKHGAESNVEGAYRRIAIELEAMDGINHLRPLAHVDELFQRQ